MFGYLIGFHLPFVIQVFATDKFVNLMCLVSCLAITVISGCEEVVKMISSKIEGNLILKRLVGFANILIALAFAAFFVYKGVNIIKSMNEIEGESGL
jgi:hypothetical protein